MSNRKTSKTSKESKSKHSVVPPKAKPVTEPVAETAAGKSAAAPVAATPAPAKAPAAPVSVVLPAKAEQPKTDHAKTEAVAKTDASHKCEAKSCEAVTAQLNALRNSSADIAREAAIELGRLRDASAVEPLIEVLFNTDGYYHSVVRAAAAESLGQLGDTRAVDALIYAIRDPMAEASAEAVRALATLNDRRAVSPLIDIVRNSWGFFLPIVRRAAVLALAKLGGPEATAELREVAANNGEDPIIRQAAQQAIA
jgi:HEAT repeat protein